jgi:hypothetical protein
MKYRWHLQRTTQTHPDGQRRWDQAYRLVLAWGQRGPTCQTTWLDLTAVTDGTEREANGTPEEATFAGRPVRAGLDGPTGAGAQH